MRGLVALAALQGFAAVALGAFGAHAATDPQAQAWLETGARMQGLHAVAALAAGLAAERGLRWARGAAWALLAGAFVFSAALYLLAAGAPRGAAALAPIGGVTLLAGWAMLGIGALLPERDRR